MRCQSEYLLTLWKNGEKKKKNNGDFNVATNMNYGVTSSSQLV